MSPMPDEVRSREFSVTPQGFSPEEVRAFLNYVADDIEAGHEPAPAVSAFASPQVGERVNEILQTAQASADSLIKEAETYARGRRAEADDNAQAVKAEVEAYAATNRAEADTYAGETRAAADSEALRVREEADTYAHDTRAAAATDAQRVRDDADGYAAETRAAAESDAQRVRAEADSYSFETRVAAEADATAVGQRLELVEQDAEARRNQMQASLEARALAGDASRQAMLERLDAATDDLRRARDRFAERDAELMAILPADPTTAEFLSAEASTTAADGVVEPDAAVASLDEQPAWPAVTLDEPQAAETGQPQWGEEVTLVAGDAATGWDALPPPPVVDTPTWGEAAEPAAEATWADDGATWSATSTADAWAAAAAPVADDADETVQWADVAVGEVAEIPEAPDAGNTVETSELVEMSEVLEIETAGSGEGEAELSSWGHTTPTWDAETPNWGDATPAWSAPTDAAPEAAPAWDASAPEPQWQESPNWGVDTAAEPDAAAAEAAHLETDDAGLVDAEHPHLEPPTWGGSAPAEVSAWGTDGGSVEQDFWAGRPASAEPGDSTWHSPWSEATDDGRWVPPAPAAEDLANGDAEGADAFADAVPANGDEDPLAAMVREAVDRVIASDADK